MRVSMWRRGCRRERVSKAMFSIGRGLFVIAALAVSSASTPAGVAVAQEPAAELVFVSPEEYVSQWGRPAAAATRVSDVARPGRPVGVAGPWRHQQGDWSTILWDESDLRGVSTPVRVGNVDLGYQHYAGPHNLTSRYPIHAAFQTHKPDKEFGAHLEYISWAVDSSGSVHLTVRVVVQAATRTDDGRYITHDGKNIGVITAYCEGYDRCPDWVNTL
jgi:hypothetical protein